MIAKRCSICGGKPKYVYYNVPMMDTTFEIFDEDEFGEMEPMILLKRIECMDCGATVPQLVMSCDDAVRYWNDDSAGHRPLLQRYGDEPCECEKGEDE